VLEAKEKRIFNRVLDEDITLKDFLDQYYNLTIDDLNAYFQTLSLSKHFDSQLLEDIEIPASTTVRIEHRLEAIPKYKIIVKQSGGGLITDGDYAQNYIELINNGASTATISVIIFKE
jgi:hypothetical protein